jgi:hypothetical protein
MKVILSISLIIEGNKSKWYGEFFARNKEDIPRVAYKWFWDIWKERGCRETVIEKVTWDEKNDITVEVNRIRKSPFN